MVALVELVSVINVFGIVVSVSVTPIMVVKVNVVCSLLVDNNVLVGFS